MTRGELYFEHPGHQLGHWTRAASIVVAVHVAMAAMASFWPIDVEPDGLSDAIIIDLEALTVAELFDAPPVAPGPVVKQAPPPRPVVSQLPLEQKAKEIPFVERAPVAPKPEVALTRSEPTAIKEPELPPAPIEAAILPQTTPPTTVQTPAALEATAPTPALSAAASEARASWRKQLVLHIDRFKHYPADARSQDIEGEAYLRFIVDRSGRVTSSRIARSSGSPVLDAEALAVIERAGLLPAPPAELQGDAFDLILPINFSIK